jgi:hypothetical protein
VKIFEFDPGEHAGDYASQGWVHIREGVSPGFHEVLLAYAREELGDHLMPGFAIRGKKEQSLFEFPERFDPYEELFDVVSRVCGLRRETMTLSERHIQIYDENANPEPPAHKDRFPSQVSVGLSISIPGDSRLVLYPYDHRELNRFNTSAGLRQSLQPHELPEVVLPGAREVELDDRDRDVVMFPGSTTWHLRRRAARSLNLYLKFNDFGADPLGEDPASDRLRAATLAAVRSGADDALDALVPVPSRRFDSASRIVTRDGWREALHAQVFGEEPFGVTPAQLEALMAADGGRSMGELAEALRGRFGEARRDLIWLAERGVLDLVPAEHVHDGVAAAPAGAARAFS